MEDIGFLGLNSTRGYLSFRVWSFKGYFCFFNTANGRQTYVISYNFKKNYTGFLKNEKISKQIMCQLEFI